MKGWKTFKLKDVCTKIGSGATPRGGKETYITEGISLIRSQNVLDFCFSDDGLAYISEEQAEQLSNVRVNAEDVLLNITGDSVARVCQAPESILPARVNQHVGIIRPDPRKLCPGLLKYYLLSPSFKSFMLGRASAGGTRNALTKGMIENFEITVPEQLKEQKAIAKILSAFDDKIELNRRMNATLEAMARALFKAWFVDFEPVHANRENRPSTSASPEIAKLFPSDFENGIPKGWRLDKLENVIELAYGKALTAENRINGEVPVYGSNGRVGFHSHALVEGPGIVVGRKGNPGTVIWVDESFFPIDTTFYVKSDLELRFVFHSLENLDLANLGGDSAVPGLSRSIAYRETFLSPPAELLERFGEVCQPFTNKIFTNAKENKLLMQIRDSLLPRLISGKLRAGEFDQGSARKVRKSYGK